MPASDLVEGLLNNVERPPVYAEGTQRELYAGEALPHFNEVDECAGVDALVTNGLWKRLGFSPETTLHDVRWGRAFRSASTSSCGCWRSRARCRPPTSTAGTAGRARERQSPMYFPLGGGTIKGMCKPGEVVWSRVFVEKGRLNCDLGRGQARWSCRRRRCEERWRLTTPQWPIMHLVMNGITRDQFMARHKANHIQVAYAPEPGRGPQGALGQGRRHGRAGDEGVDLRRGVAGGARHLPAPIVRADRHRGLGRGLEPRVERVLEGVSRPC